MPHSTFTLGESLNPILEESQLLSHSAIATFSLLVSSLHALFAPNCS
jgi:hypothetical protein